jgi:hypothetical protein
MMAETKMILFGLKGGVLPSHLLKEDIEHL